MFQKQKNMVISKNAVVPKINIVLDGQTVDHVERFMYLGQIITQDGRCQEEIRNRIRQAKSAFINMRDVLCCRKLNLTSRIRLLKCYVWSTSLYGVETWTVSETSRKKLEAFEMWALRRMMRISWTRRLSNEHVLDLAKQKRELFSTVQIRKLVYLGHVMRHESMQRDLIEGMVEGKRGRGRPRLQ